MLSPDEIRLKIEALESEAARLGDPDGAPYREMAMKWRLLAVEAVFMDAVRGTLNGDEDSAER